MVRRRLFPVAPPVVRVPARQFPVTLHFARRTELHDYVGAALKKVHTLAHCSAFSLVAPGVSTLSLRRSCQVL